MHTALGRAKQPTAVGAGPFAGMTDLGATFGMPWTRVAVVLM